uniref:Uncharacterized protein n=1 Tax=Kalanchoe fedtschenkoi TaxID=63787 RepID=A0A7N0VAF1_KALFE
MMLKKAVGIHIHTAYAVAAAVVTALSAIQISHQGEDDSTRAAAHSPTAKFEPRFDGLRFIETLVTAHR